MNAEILSSSSLVAVVFATWLGWQLSELVVLYDPVAGWVRRMIAVYRLRRKWARFRTTHPEVF